MVEPANGWVGGHWNPQESFLLFPQVPKGRSSSCEWSRRTQWCLPEGPSW